MLPSGDYNDITHAIPSHDLSRMPGRGFSRRASGRKMPAVRLLTWGIWWVVRGVWRNPRSFRSLVVDLQLFCLQEICRPGRAPPPDHGVCRSLWAECGETAWGMDQNRICARDPDEYLGPCKTQILCKVQKIIFPGREKINPWGYAEYKSPGWVYLWQLLISLKNLFLKKTSKLLSI